MNDTTNSTYSVGKERILKGLYFEVTAKGD